MKYTSFLKSFLLSIFYSSFLILSVPQYVECEDFYPDELLDVFGIPKNPVTFSNTGTPQPVVFSSPNPIPYAHPFQCRQAEGSYLHTFTSELVFSVTLRR